MLWWILLSRWLWASPLSCQDLFSVPHLSPGITMTPSTDMATLVSPIRDAVIRQNLSQDMTLELQKILSQKKQLHTTPKESLLELFEFFAKTNLLPPTTFTTFFYRALNKSLPTWNENDFRRYADYKKRTPMQESRDFLQGWKHLVRNKFLEWPTKTQLEVLSLELYQNRDWMPADWTFFLSEVTQSLENSPTNEAIKSLKELYRGFLFMDPSRMMTPSELIQRLILQIQLHLTRQNISLLDAGRSWSLTKNRALGSSGVSYLRMVMEHEFPNQTVIDEYSDPLQPGLFDPVDLYYPDLKLIIEWDGFQHYYRRLRENGQLDENFYEIRLFDQIKDAVLRKNGFLVLRLSRFDQTKIDTLSLRDLIQEQNPGADIPQVDRPIFFLNQIGEDMD